MIGCIGPLFYLIIFVSIFLWIIGAISGSTLLFIFGISVALIIYSEIKLSEEKKEQDKVKRTALRIKKNQAITKFNSNITNVLDKLFILDYSLSKYDEIKETLSTPVFNFAIACDNKLKTLCLFDKNSSFFYFKKEDITRFELRTISKMITEGETIKEGSLSRAVVGGLIAGGAGAVVGGVTGKEKHSSTSQEVLTYYLDVYTTNTDLPFFTITGSETDLKKWNAYILAMTTI